MDTILRPALFPFSLCLFFPPPEFVLPILDSRRRVSHSPLFLSFPRRPLPVSVYPSSSSLSVCLFFCLLKPAIAARAYLCRAQRSERNNRVSERDEKYYRRLGAGDAKGRRDEEREKRVMDGSGACVCVCTRARACVGARVEGMGLADGDEAMLGYTKG